MRDWIDLVESPVMQETERSWWPIVDRVVKRYGQRLLKPKLAFNICKSVSLGLAQELKTHGFDARVMRVSVPRVPFLQAFERWSEFDTFYWVHYLVKVGDTAIDMTRRQFDPKAPVPWIEPWRKVQDEWEEVSSYHR